MMASYKLSAMTESVKCFVSYCVKWAIGVRVEGVFNYTNVVKSLRVISKEKIRIMRPNDPVFDVVLQKI